LISQVSNFLGQFTGFGERFQFTPKNYETSIHINDYLQQELLKVKESRDLHEKIKGDQIEGISR